MIESLFSPKVARQKPWVVFFAATVFTLISILLVFQVVSPGQNGAGMGLLLVSFITIAATPLFLTLFKIEEEEEKKVEKEGLLSELFKRHADIIKVLGFFFIAIIFTSSIFSVLMPKTSAIVFADQTNDLLSRGIISARATNGINFFEILFNNLKVLVLIFIFSFVFGAGAIFVLSWNATVIGTLIAKIAENPAQYGFITIAEGNSLANYIIALPYTLLRLLPHGLFEFFAYFIAAVAGGILSVAIIREKLLTEKEIIFKDICCYMAIAAIFIFIGAAIESI